jgi:class 3 adenylate cyclase/pimeloyl-ACP methyl ester carboxylesterase
MDQGTRYARCGDLSIAYEVKGDGPVDLVHVAGNLVTLEAAREPPISGLVDRASRFARQVLFDKRGTGLSDRYSPDVTPTIEDRVEDIRVVMDAAGIERAALLGMADGGPVAMMFAASYPERTLGLVLTGTAPRIAWAPDYPWGRTDVELGEFLDMVDREWGTGVMEGFLADMGDRALIGRYERLASTPAVAVRLYRAYFDTDVRDVLPTITAPTLVVHNELHARWPIEGARYIADRIPGARLVELPGTPGAESIHRLFEQAEVFLAGDHVVTDVDRVLKTVLFTDIVGSTERAAEVGDRRWRELLDAHDAATRTQLARFGGAEVKTTGDGFLAAFDGPARAIRCAQAVAVEADRLGVQVRSGVHTGECEQRGDDLAGIAVHIGARVVALAGPGEVLVTSTVRDLVAGSGLGFDDRGRTELRGVPGEWQVLAVRG